MIARTTCLLLALLGTAASAASLPLKPGTYVQAGSACRDPAFAVMFDYDGQRFSYPHASGCTSKVVSHKGHVYRVSETCSANGDGSASTPTTMQTTYTILSNTRVRVGHGSTAPSAYRWCGASGAKQPHG